MLRQALVPAISPAHAVSVSTHTPAGRTATQHADGFKMGNACVMRPLLCSRGASPKPTHVTGCCSSVLVRQKIFRPSEHHQYSNKVRPLPASSVPASGAVHCHQQLMHANGNISHTTSFLPEKDRAPITGYHRDGTLSAIFRAICRSTLRTTGVQSSTSSIFTPMFIQKHYGMPRTHGELVLQAGLADGRDRRSASDLHSKPIPLCVQDTRLLLM